MEGKNIAQLIDEKPMSMLQYATIMVCFLMNILDGVDVLVISYCAPVIAKSWGLSSEALGVVFSSGLAGMTVGALGLAPFADKIGRKKIIFISNTILAISVFATAYSQSVNMLLILRFLSGLGIGSMLASTTALTSEYSSAKVRSFWVSFVVAGYPLGAVLTGLVAAEVVPASGWQTMFKLSGIASLLTLPLIILFTSESIIYYLKAQPKHALIKVNHILGKMNYTLLKQLPIIEQKNISIPVKQLFSSSFRVSTLQLWGALFLAFTALYFLISWIPKLAESTGLSIELAIYAGTVFNGGAFIGVLTQGYFSSRWGLKKTIGYFLILAAILMLVFQLFMTSNLLLVIFGLLGFLIQGGFVGLYAMAAQMYPTNFKVTGVGWSIGIGRFGGVIGPALGGILVGLGLDLGKNMMVFAVPCLIGGFLAWKIKTNLSPFGNSID